MVYEPQEDSRLLARHVARLAYGNVLDMGTGSGIQAHTAAQSERVDSVIAADVDPRALIEAKKYYNHPKIQFKLSDLFSKIKGKFDTIIFNPPYLPAEQGLDDVALVGGRHGYETMCRFLNDAMEHLNPDGQIISVYSSLTKPFKVEESARRLLLEPKELDKEHVFFEDLIVTLFTKNTARKEIEKDGFRDIQYLAKGTRGVVVTAKYKSIKVAIKAKQHTSAAIAAIEIEAAMLSRVNKIGIGPKLVRAGKNYVAYKFVEGTFLPEYLEGATRTLSIKVLREVLDQCRTLDKAGISKEEMTRPIKHVIVGRSGTPVMIDFERAGTSMHPQNVTQFCQYITSTATSIMLIPKKIIIDKDDMISAAKKYSQEPTDKNYNIIKAMIK